MADYTYPSVLSMYALMAVFVAGAAFFLVRGVLSGAVSGDEAPKIRMLEDEDPEVEARGGEHE